MKWMGVWADGTPGLDKEKSKTCGKESGWGCVGRRDPRFGQEKIQDVRQRKWMGFCALRRFGEEKGQYQ